MLFVTIIGGILVLFIYITRLAPNEIFSSSNKIHREVGRAKDLSAPRYLIEAPVSLGHCETETNCQLKGQLFQFLDISLDNLSKTTEHLIPSSL